VNVSTCDTLCMYKEHVVQRLYNDAGGVRPCELCGCRYDPVKMQAHMQRYMAARWCASRFYSRRDRCGTSSDQALVTSAPNMRRACTCRLKSNCRHRQEEHETFSKTRPWSFALLNSFFRSLHQCRFLKRDDFEAGVDLKPVRRPLRIAATTAVLTKGSRLKQRVKLRQAAVK
jgi:hypothetical protein